jgi:hypothetical protein
MNFIKVIADEFEKSQMQQVITKSLNNQDKYTDISTNKPKQ